MLARVFHQVYVSDLGQIRKQHSVCYQLCLGSSCSNMELLIKSIWMLILMRQADRLKTKDLRFHNLGTDFHSSRWAVGSNSPKTDNAIVKHHLCIVASSSSSSSSNSSIPLPWEIKSLLYQTHLLSLRPNKAVLCQIYGGGRERHEVANVCSVVGCSVSGNQGPLILWSSYRVAIPFSSFDPPPNSYRGIQKQYLCTF